MSLLIGTSYYLKSSSVNCNFSFPSVLSILPMLGPMSYLQAHQPPRSFNWRRGRDMLFGTHRACAAVLNGKVYIGGGEAVRDEFIIQVYTPVSDGWNRLPKCPVKYFSMAVVNQQLVLVGGCNRHYRNQSTILVWGSTSQRWATPYPNMPTARTSPAAVGYQQCLVVAGGEGDSSLTAVEILNSSTKRWSTISPLPIQCNDLTPAVVGDTLYLLGGETGPLSPNNQMFSFSLPALVSHAVSTPRAPPPAWEATDTELTWSTAVSLHDSLLAVGGKNDQGRHSSAIRLYNTQTRQWTKVGDVPAALSWCTSAVLPSGELIVLGGYGGGGRRSTKLFVATVN